MKIFKFFDFSPGVVVYNELELDISSVLDPDNPFLTEDMFLVKYP
jgi:hypothetical protein